LFILIDQYSLQVFVALKRNGRLILEKENIGSAFNREVGYTVEKNILQNCKFIPPSDCYRKRTGKI